MWPPLTRPRKIRSVLLLIYNIYLLNLPPITLLHHPVVPFYLSFYSLISHFTPGCFFSFDSFSKETQALIPSVLFVSQDQHFPLPFCLLHHTTIFSLLVWCVSVCVCKCTPVLLALTINWLLIHHLIVVFKQLIFYSRQILLWCKRIAIKGKRGGSQDNRGSEKQWCRLKGWTKNSWHSDMLYRPEALFHLSCIRFCWFYCIRNKTQSTTKSRALHQTPVENLHRCYLACQLYDRCCWKWPSRVQSKNHISIYHPFFEVVVFLSSHQQNSSILSHVS